MKKHAFESDTTECYREEKRYEKKFKKQLITTVLSMGIVISLLSGCGDQKRLRARLRKRMLHKVQKGGKRSVNTGLAAGDTSVLEKKAGKMRDITSQQLIKEMKIGWNLGNSLDVCEADTDGDGKVNQTPKPGKKGR